MPWDTLRLPALGHLYELLRLLLAAPTHALDLGLSCSRAPLGQLFCDMSCIVDDNHSKKNHTS